MDDDDGFVDVFAKSTGRPQRVPAHFMEHPEFKKLFRKTPPPDGATPIPITETPAAGDKE